MWAHVVDGEVVNVGHHPPPSIVLEDESVVLGAAGLPAADLAAYGWLPIVDDGPTWDRSAQAWEGEGPTLVVEGDVVRASYTYRDLTDAELVERAMAPLLVDQANEVADLGPEPDPAELAALEKAHQTARTAERRRLGRRPAGEPDIVDGAPLLVTPAPPQENTEGEYSEPQ